MTLTVFDSNWGELKPTVADAVFPHIVWRMWLAITLCGLVYLRIHGNHTNYFHSYHILYASGKVIIILW